MAAFEVTTEVRARGHHEAHRMAHVPAYLFNVTGGKRGKRKSSTRTDAVR